MKLLTDCIPILVVLFATVKSFNSDSAASLLLEDLYALHGLQSLK